MAIIVSAGQQLITQAIFSGVGTISNLGPMEKESLKKEAIKFGASKVLKLVQNEIRVKLIYAGARKRSRNTRNDDIDLTVEELSHKRYSDQLNNPGYRKQEVKRDPQSYKPRIASLIRYDLKNLGSSKDVSENEIKFQCVPLEMDYEPSSNWVTIPTVGRNNPFYHYTGGEDILKFTLDWYSNNPDTSDVIEKCRFIEALTRNDGYDKEPPEVILVFGDLFKRSKWVVTAAPYKLSVFDNANGLLPKQAYQEITLRRSVKVNRKWSDILGVQ